MHCSHCKKPFEITTEDQQFYSKMTQTIGEKKFTLPPPTLCVNCRRQRRLAFRNERNLYNRKCSLCQKSIVSIYSADKDKTVYCPDCFWSDNWNPFGYGQDFDFSQPFFPQFQKLFERVPALSLILDKNENSTYNNSCAELKNCYLCFDGGFAQDCLYGETFDYLKDCIDFLFLQHCELCYQCVNCFHCYELFYSRFCEHCSNSYFLMDCTGCKNCFGCVNLVQKEYCWFNQQLSKAAYEQKLAEFNRGSFHAHTEMAQQVKAFWTAAPKRAYRGTMNEDSTGDNIFTCHRSYENFDCKDLQDCNHCQQVILPAQDCHDLDKWGGNTELVYNCSGVGSNAQCIIASYYTAFNANAIYHSAYCWFGSSNLLGCVGLNRHKQYCVLNKQYTKEAYEALVGKIIEHMQTTGEWGQFFPPSISAFGYNESVAQEYFPLTKEAALAEGFKWSDYQNPAPNATRIIEAEDLADEINAVSDEILTQAIRCSESKKLFVLTKSELAFYRAHQIPLPRLHPNQRNYHLKKEKNPRQLWLRNCAQCKKDIQTSYAPERAEKVYCENCYTQTIQ